VTGEIRLVDLAELLADGLLRLQPPDRAALDASLGAAARDVEAAKANVETFPAWAETMFYEAGLRCARAVVAAAGYRISTERGHVTAIDAADALTAGSHHPIFVRLHRMRRTRHEFMYETRPDPSRTDLDRAARDVERLLEVALSAVARIELAEADER
jgi:hypothetical protein